MNNVSAADLDARDHAVNMQYQEVKEVEKLTEEQREKVGKALFNRSNIGGGTLWENLLPAQREMFKEQADTFAKYLQYQRGECEPPTDEEVKDSCLHSNNGALILVPASVKNILQWFCKHRADERNALREELKALKQENERLKAAILWTNGQVGDFAPRPEGAGAFWWRRELMERAGISKSKTPEERVTVKTNGGKEVVCFDGKPVPALALKSLLIAQLRAEDGK